MSLFRKAILTVTGTPLISSFVSNYGMRLGASRFVAGETMEEALEAVKKLNQIGLFASLDYLGESVTSHEKAKDATHSLLWLLDAIKSSSVRSNISIKLTQLGLDIDREFCLENLNLLASKAQEHNNFIRVDMEDSPRIDDTLYILNHLLESYGKDHVGAVIQSYLLRSEKDVINLGKKGANIRIVKGAYKEPRDISFYRKQDVNDNYIKLVKRHLKNGCYTAIATHDIHVISTLKKWITKHAISSDLYEFQMLYGICTHLQKELVNEGYKVRSYIPYGKEWYPYFARRIAERPANALFVLRNLQRK